MGNLPIPGALLRAIKTAGLRLSPEVAAKIMIEQLGSPALARAYLARMGERAEMPWWQKVAEVLDAADTTKATD